MKAQTRGKTVALVPMRHHSERVAGKNYRKLGGLPLYHHIVRTLVACPSIDEVVIDTDSPVIVEDALAAFPSVRILSRPEHLRGDLVPMTEVLFHDISQVEADCYLQTHSTNPFIRAETLERALGRWREERPLFDSVFSVTRLQARLWDSTCRPLNHNPWLLLRTQDLPPLYIENSCFYLFSAELMKSSRRRIGDRPLLFEMDPLEAVDIDTEQDFLFAEVLMRSREASQD